MTLRAWIKNAAGKPCCPTHFVEGMSNGPVSLVKPVVLTYIEQAEGALKERWVCPVDREEFLAEEP